MVCKHEANLYIAAKVVVLSLGSSIAINPGYSSISLEHRSHTVTTTETKTKVLDGAERERERERDYRYYVANSTYNSVEYISSV